MKKSAILILVLAIMITACNTSKVVNSPTIDPNILDTEVALQLSSTPIQNNQTQVSSPEVPTDTPLPPTETATPTITPTTTPTATPTQDWKASLGDPTWKTTFDSTAGFFSSGNSYSDDYTTISISGGVMHISSISTFGYRGWRMSSKKPQNFYLEAKFAPVSCSGNDTYGIVFRAPDYSSGYGYYLTLTCDGRIAMTKWDDAGSSIVFDYISDPIFKGGAGQTNLFGIMVKGSDFKVYVNNKLITEVSDYSISDAGSIGVFIAGYSGGLTVELDDLAYWNQ
jgi:hypothetical protein